MMKKLNNLLKENELEIIDNKINMIYSTKDFMDENYEVIENGCDMIEINVYYDLNKNQFVYEHLTQWKTIYKYEDFPLSDFITFLKESTWGFDSWFDILYNDALDGSEVYEKVIEFIEINELNEVTQEYIRFELGYYSIYKNVFTNIKKNGSLSTLKTTFENYDRVVEVVKYLENQRSDTHKIEKMLQGTLINLNDIEELKKEGK